MGLALMVALLGVLFVLLRGKIGAGVQAIRDDEIAAASVGVQVHNGKRVMFVLAAAGCAAAGAVDLASTISYQPHAFFGIQWTAYMLFMALVGGLGTFEGPIIGAIVFFAIETFFGATGVAYLIGLGVVALGFALFIPRGIYGFLEARFGLRLLPVGYSLNLSPSGGAAKVAPEFAARPDA
jgi:branched-chain amino acid transport system permease protein